jgi:hypothetical protein
MTAPRDPDSVEPALRQAEAKLARHLEEACEDVEQKDLSQESLEELLQLEDELLAAARAAEETVRLRRQRGERPGSNREASGPGPTAAPAEPADETVGYRVREFRDRQGKSWRVWQVRPGSTGRAANPERYLGEYVNGWLAFETLEGDARKRLPRFPTGWLGMSDAELELLLPQATEVRRRLGKDAAPR